MNLPPLYCIWNRELGDRREISEAHFKEHGLDVTFFEGIHGKTFDLKAATPCTIDGPNNHYFISPGHIGLNLSWYMLWTHLWHLGIDEAICLEDDAFFKDGFKENFLAEYSNIPAGADLVYLGWLERHERPLKRLNGRVCQMTDGCPFGTHSILIRRSGIRKLLDTQRAGRNHVDISIWKRTLPKMEWYVLQPSLVLQRSQNGNPDKPDAFRPSV